MLVDGFIVWDGRVNVFGEFSRNDVYVKDWPLMQFTGLMDKNGKEIYEGDVLKHYGGSPKIPDRQYVVEWHEKVTGVLLVDKSKTMQQTWWRDGSWLWRVSKHLEIIGNIYQHPELLRP